VATVLNGRIDSALLTPIDTYGHRLRSGAAAAWLALQAEVQRRYGWTPKPSNGLSTYRTLADQQKLIDEGLTTAAAGKSNHGWGKAVDVAGLVSFTSTRYVQFKTVAVSMGWSNAEGASIREYWHWVFTGVLDIDTTPNEDDMPLSNEDLGKIGELVKEIFRSPEFQQYFAMQPVLKTTSPALGPALQSQWITDTRVDTLRILDIVKNLSATDNGTDTGGAVIDVDALAKALARAFGQLGN